MSTPALWLDLGRHTRLGAPGALRALSRKDAALLAVLALDGACARDTLAAMLWPEATPVTARASLRQRRFRLARAVGQAVVDGEETLRLASTVSHAALRPETRLADDEATLDGELLEGLAFDDCPEIERWLQLARERWRVMRAQALARVASALEAEGRIAQALGIAQRLAADEPLSDHAHRRLMRLHHLRGDLGAALQVYRDFAAGLERELGELPDDETAALAALLRQGQAPARSTAPMPPTLARPPRLVGREAAWATLDAAWSEGASLLLEGAPGLGKSRLLGDYLQGRGATLSLAAQPGDTERPYALLTRLLARMWLDPGAPWPQGAAALPAWARRELAALLPELGGDAAHKVDALRLQRAVQAALAPPPGARPLQVVALDDVQQADAATLELLPALTGPGLPHWWLAVRRGEQPPAVARWAAASVPPRQVMLVPLDVPQLQALVADVAPGLPGTDAQTLWRYTGGIPLFVLETLRSLYERPAGPAADTAYAAAPPSPPAAAAALVQARLQRLPETARQLAGAAAVYGTPVSLADSAALLGGAPLDWAAAFEALQATQWLDPHGGLHDLVRAAVLDALPEALRRWLHGRAAAWRGQQGAPASQLAHHWQGAGRPDLAAPAWEAAARDARRRARPAEEVALWERCITAWEAAGQPDAAWAAWRESVEPRLYVHGPDAVKPQTEALLARAGSDSQRLDALIAHAGVLMVTGDNDTVRRLAQQAGALARRRRDAAQELRAGQLQSTALAQLQALPAALKVLDGLAPLLPRLPAQRYAFLSTRSWVLHRAGRLGECARVLARCIALSQQAGDLVEACTSSSNMASLLVSLGRYDDALAAVQQALAWRAQIGPAQGVHAANVDLNHGYVLLGLGRVDEALAAIEQAQQVFARSGGLLWSVIGANALASAELMRGDASAAAARLIAPGEQTPVFIAARHHVLAARTARALGQDPAPALTRAEAVLGTQGDPVQGLAVQAERLLSLPDERAAEAAAALGELQAQAMAREQFTNAARLGWLRVQRLLAAGDAAAAAAATQALLARGAPRPIDLLPAAMWQLAARAYAEAGDRRRAVAARRRAAAEPAR